MKFFNSRSEMFLCMVFGAGLLLVEGVTIPQINPGRKFTTCLFNRKCTLSLTQVGSVLLVYLIGSVLFS